MERILIFNNIIAKNAKNEANLDSNEVFDVNRMEGLRGCLSASKWMQKTSENVIYKQL